MAKAPDAISREEEVAALGVEEVVKNGKTVFAKDDEGHPFIWDYHIKGFFKEACGTLKSVDDSLTSKESKKGGALTAYKKKIDNFIFIKERKLFFHKDGEKVSPDMIGDLQRPLRAMTMQGERVALADSETVPAGSYIEFTVQTLEGKLEPIIKEWLDYGVFKGLGQWRNASWGRFEWEEIA